MDSISLRDVRYRPEDLYSLQQDLAHLVNEPRHDVGDDASTVSRAVSDIRYAWKFLQFTRYELLEDTLPSDMIGEHLQDVEREAPENHFEHAARGLQVLLDRRLLDISGGIRLSSTVEVTAGLHSGRTGSVRSVSWPMDHEQHTSDPLRSPAASSSATRAGRSTSAPTTW